MLHPVSKGDFNEKITYPIPHPTNKRRKNKITYKARLFVYKKANSDDFCEFITKNCRTLHGFLKRILTIFKFCETPTDILGPILILKGKDALF